MMSVETDATPAASLNISRLRCCRKATVSGATESALPHFPRKWESRTQNLKKPFYHFMTNKPDLIR
ncbi:hypothetical protein EZZ75_11705 [Neisseria meningitidis]|nr:hypothetical protein [Neisseria meningitidis]